MSRTPSPVPPAAALALPAALLACLLLPAAATADAGAPPAGGAPIGEVIAATLATSALMAGLIAVGLARRSGRAGIIAPLERLAERSLALPGWAALSVSVATFSLLAAVFGLYWDISLHIDDGRDEGPLANPAHYFILGGLLGIFAAGWLAVVLPRERPGPAAVRLAPGWQAPVGGLVMMACASFAALGFPLDDVWHRLFGQDVTLWGPTHLMMLTGAAMTLVGIFILIVEGRLARGDRSAGSGGASGPLSFFSSPRLQYVLAGGGLLAGLSIYQGEFDFGVPQFSLLYHPVLITLAGSVSLIAARLLAGPGGAIGAVAFFLVLRGVITLLVGPVFGQSVPHFPLFIVAALLVEAIAWRMGTERPYRLAAVAGAAIATAGVLAEWAWTQVWMPLAWPAHVLPEALALSLPVGVAGGAIAAFLAGALALRPGAAGRRPALAAAAGVVVIAATIGYLLPTSAPERATASVALTESQAAPERRVHATIRLEPPGLGEDADWLQGMAWQGRERIVVAPLERVSADLYRTSEPLPAGGEWKSLIRLHRGRTIGAVPVYAPEDAAIPAAEIPAPPRFQRAFRSDRDLLQRERRADVPGWAWTAGSLTVLALGLCLLALLGWALRRLAASASARGAGARSGPGATPSTAAPRSAPTPAGVSRA